MRDLQDNDETLFYSLIAHNIEELLPIVYTPAVGEGCQRFSRSGASRAGCSSAIRTRIASTGFWPTRTSRTCAASWSATASAFSGLGDQGAGGMGIPIGKMALYTALGGIPPEHCLPVLLDVGTDNEALLDDPIYIGWQHHRVRGQEYDDFIEAFVSAVERRWPHILLQWEDFAGDNAARLLEHYRDRLCTFNDDIQGTAAVTTATLLAAVNATGIPLQGADHRHVRLRIGRHRHCRSAGGGDERRRPERRAGAQAHLRLQSPWPARRGRRGHSARAAAAGAQARGRGRVEALGSEAGRDISLLDVVRNAGITVLAGVSAQAGAFTEEIVREMARHTPRPVIFPLSNPTSQAEAAPADLLRWTEGRALVGTGSPFAPVEVNGRLVRIAQVNNSYIFPGLALGILVSRARRVTDGMIMAAAKALASLSPARTDKNAPLLPPIAECAQNEPGGGRGGGQAGDRRRGRRCRRYVAGDRRCDYMWEPVYLPYERHNLAWMESEGIPS